MGVCLPGSDATPEDYQSIAVHFENEKNHFMAGKFFLLSEQFVRVGTACRSQVHLHGSESTQSVCQGGYGLLLAGSTSMVQKALKVFVFFCLTKVPKGLI